MGGGGGKAGGRGRRRGLEKGSTTAGPRPSNFDEASDVLLMMAALDLLLSWMAPLFGHWARIGWDGSERASATGRVRSRNAETDANLEALLGMSL